ncbi:hypothetical protein ACFRQM_44030 [Streptomyces sp. NPDC056831]|uniref:hypothetical protein n=1 Tax=Streptomyces sp. NPDC056831 TaxID=3345954 RepID=UPI00367822EE
MPSRSRPHGLLRPAAARINARIRQLMDEPDTEDRAEEYRQLLVQWAKATQSRERGPAWVPRQRGRTRPSSSSARQSCAMDGTTVAAATDTGRGQVRSSPCRSGCALA